MYLNDRIWSGVLLVNGLTITWDVFEFCLTDECLKYGIRLTITWDVFEWPQEDVLHAPSRFNYNMGCI